MEVGLMVGLIIFFAMVVLLSIGCPISVSMGIASVASIFVVLSQDKVAITSAQRIFTGINSFSLLAIPFFVLAGNIMCNGGIARKLINCGMALIGFMPGALAQTNVISNMFFGAVSGSGVAAAAAVGGVLAPIEQEEGYDADFAAAVNIASAPCGMLIPPSNTFIVYSLASGGVSIAALFMAGYVPGFLWALGVLLLAVYFSKKLGYKSNNIQGIKSKIRALMDAIPSLLLIVIIVGGILGGYFTATEASCIAVVYSLILSFLYRTIKVKDISGILLASAKTTGMIIFMIGISSILSWIMAYTKIPQMLSAGLLNLTENTVIIMLLMNVFMLFMGCVMDPTPGILIFTPIFLPIAVSLGFHPVHFGVIMVFNFCIGTITPPVGPILFTGCKIANLRIEQVIKRLMPFFLVEIIFLMLVTFIPQISLAIPRLLGLI